MRLKPIRFIKVNNPHNGLTCAFCGKAGTLAYDWKSKLCICGLCLEALKELMNSSEELKL